MPPGCHHGGMDAINLLAPGSARDHRRAGSAHPAPSIGGSQMGACLLELAGDEPSDPYHFHHGVEEWLLVVSGSPRVRTPEGDRTLRAGDLACFPVGPSGAHRVAGPGTVLIVAERRALDVIEYPESGEIELRPSGRTFRGPPSGEADAGDRRASEPVNLHDVAVEGDASAPPGYRARQAELRPRLGAERLGGTVYELDPGESVCPYHYEGVEEEWVLVLTGPATLRDPDGEHELGAGDLVCLPVGPDGGHKVSNRSAGVVRVLILSTMPENELSICVYPDSAKVAVWPWPGQRLRLGDPIGYWDGEV
jgi:uncharacterized cupin superfamily protein